MFVFYLLVQFLHVHPSQFLVLNIRGPYLRQDKLLHSTPRSPLKYSGVILWWRRSRLSRFGVMGSSVLRVEDHPFRHSADAIERYRVAVMSLLPLFLVILSANPCILVHTIPDPDSGSCPK